MKRLWKLLNSRKFGVYLLLVLVAVLMVSSFLPSPITLSDEEWSSLRERKPFVFWLSENFSTIYLVRNPLFLALSAFLFLSTLACTITRIKWWAKARKSEFEKDKAFSFSVEERSSSPVEAVKENLLDTLRRRRWEFSVSGEGGGFVVEAQKGIGMGFWGSVVFHIGLVVCFIVAPVSALTVFRGEFLITEGITMPLRDGFVSHEGKALSSLPDTDITVYDAAGEYAKGRYKVQFGGVMRAGNREFPFSVNNPVTVEGYQFSLGKFGFSPGIVLEKEGSVLFDYFLNLRHSGSGDYFDLPSEGLTLFVLLFPDFIREGNKIGSRSKDPNNPVCLIKLLRGKEEVAKGLVEPGEEARVGDYLVRFTELRNWVGFVVVREWGVYVLALGMATGILGLLVRFLSNERRLEARLSGAGPGTTVALRGYSRYYPAFLEKEVREMAGKISGGG
jgi:cytochrome c biogenesis protein